MPKLGTPKQLRRMLAKTLDLATPTLRVLARKAGISYHAIRQYRKGMRTPPPVVVRRLAKALRAQSGTLARAAGGLEAAVGRR